MRIKKIWLHNFRNFHRSGEVEFPDASLLVAAAPNATGKTNFLEAITVLLRGKSFRSSHEECVRWGEDNFLVQGVVQYGDTEARLGTQYHISSRKLRVEENGMPVSPVTFYSHYPFMVFLPEDTFMFHRGPALRRNFFNTALVSSSQYLAAVVQYHRALRQRNAALKEASSKEAIAPWTAMLVEHAAVVWAHRESFIDYIRTHIDVFYEELFDEKYQFEVDFVPGASNPAKFSSLLDEAWVYEQRYRYTLYGPHRDDMRITIDGRPAASALSRGQMRSLVIALKVAAFNFMKQVTNEQPLLLFDEVLSELDERRQRVLLEHLPSAQTILTCTSIPDGILRQDGVHVLDLRRIIQGGEEAQKEEKVEVQPPSENESELAVQAEDSNEQVVVRS